MNCETWNGIRFIAQHLPQKFHAGGRHIAKEFQSQMHIFYGHPADDRIKSLAERVCFLVNIFLYFGWNFNRDEEA
jgi:hypothetical protein